MTTLTKNSLYSIIVILLALDMLFWYGAKRDIEFITDLKVIIFFIAFIGFAFSYYLLYKTDIKHKAVLNIVITIGVLINLRFIFLWYMLKDFGF